MAKLENELKTVSVVIPDNAHWPAEFAGWRPVKQKTTRSLDGSQITQARPLINGMPIELSGFWLPRSQLEVIKAWVDSPANFVLTLPDSREFNVIFSDDSPLVAAPVFEVSKPTNETIFEVTRLAFLTV